MVSIEMRMMSSDSSEYYNWINWPMGNCEGWSIVFYAPNQYTNKVSLIELY